ncbi:MAG: YitT family protein [Eubacteriales bacterium]
MNDKVRKISKSIFDYIAISIGCVIMAFGFNSFLVPCKIAPGGFSGLAMVIYYFTGFPIGLVTLVLTIPLFFISIKRIGTNFGLKSFYGTIFFSICIDLIVKTPPLTSDIFLASVFGGILLGVGIGVIFRFGGTTGGTDLLAAIINRYLKGVTIGTLLLVIDFIVVAIAGFAFRQIEVTLYSILTIYISMRLIDLIQEGISYAKAFYIISDQSDKIAAEIIEVLDRGVTALRGKGMFTKNEKEVLFCIVHRAQVFQMKEIVQSIDAKAFVILADVHEVLGEGFKNIQEKNKEGN